MQFVNAAKIVNTVRLAFVGFVSKKQNNQKTSNQNYSRIMLINSKMNSYVLYFYLYIRKQHIDGEYL